MTRQTDQGVLDELEAIAVEADGPMVRAMNALARAAYENDTGARIAAKKEIERLLGNAMAKADIAGRRNLITDVNRLQVLDPNEPLSIADTVSIFYVQNHAPKLGAVIDQNVVERVAAAVAAGRDSAVDVMSEVGDWNRAYADTVYRTNLAAAHSAGRFQQLQDPAVLAVVPALELTAIGDRDTRPNHEAASGLVAAVNDVIWETYSTPLGYNCRCGMRLVDRFELQSRGLLSPDGTVKIHYPPNWPNAHPDPGFGTGRPDHRIYGGHAA